MNRVKIKSYAKINLTLEIVGKQNEYHNLDSLVASLDLFDLVDVKARRDRKNRITMYGMGSEFIPAEQNNALKAAEAFSKAFDTNGVDITVYKNIPIGAGLGGSSADAVGVLLGMAKLYGVTDKQALKNVADSLGSDTGYMLTGGFARMQGRGELVTKIESDLKLHFFLICPDSFVSSKACYQEYAKTPAYTSGESTQKAIAALQGKDVYALGRCLTNALFEPAKRLNREVEKAYEEGGSFAPEGVVMTGSGSCVAALFDCKELCDWARSRYKGAFKVYTATTVIPDYGI